MGYKEKSMEEPAAMMYGDPAALKLKSHPLYKKGKMSPSYKTDLKNNKS